ncbi:MAG: hypothetical protein A3G33_01880 [Omnitrophica bacterium RIFCSPLOWO2_12_FULL_44_17]|uniref:BSD domain-containing protein n=1 Tax=Candidatus Danuiimicrobium aquiferis TaxID=1801832 RepID=A0A1G1KT31_9BACT|nr:MAG: hypothetical protein A3B72_03990 [Omnitrophica bacterium RIFCSPHIGHO2_02_FULL_45_28]OGW89088.1 MAG: hypothetical protein A3E74_05565 [Omnitrophica bacterium RIFCSPHIGHO2_12_FULL_44_12]OGW96088.1 MAG: hypothetical protein A3G33_01880 [Omnitrophica bacterium RIFCSPLOWO2_12_FULL_44_17]
MKTTYRNPQIRQWLTTGFILICSLFLLSTYLNAQDYQADQKTNTQQATKSTAENPETEAASVSIDNAYAQTSPGFLSQTTDLKEFKTNTAEWKELMRLSDELVRERVARAKNLTDKPSKSNWIEYIANFWNAFEKETLTEQQVNDFNLIETPKELKITDEDASVAYEVLQTDYDSIVSQEIMETATNVRYRDAFETSDTIYGNADGRTTEKEMLNYYSALVEMETTAVTEIIATTPNDTLTISDTPSPEVNMIQENSETMGIAMVQEKSRTMGTTMSVNSTLTEMPGPSNDLDVPLSWTAQALKDFMGYLGFSVDSEEQDEAAIAEAEKESKEKLIATHEKVKTENPIQTGREKLRKTIVDTQTQQGTGQKKGNEIAQKNKRDKESDLITKFARSKNEMVELSRNKKSNEEKVRKQRSELESTRKRLYTDTSTTTAEASPIKNTASEKLVSDLTVVR